MNLAGFLFALLPLILLLVALVLGRYPGEATLERIRGIIDAVFRSGLARRPRRTPVPARVRLARGGALIARSLAGRAPPVPA